MKNLKSKNRKRFALIVFIMLIHSSIFVNIIDGNQTTKPVTNDSLSLNKSNFDPVELNKWKHAISKADQNDNGMNDNFEVRLEQLSEFGSIEADFDDNKAISHEKDTNDYILGNNKPKIENITSDNIPIIISFPKGDYDSISLLFENFGGEIKSTYKAAINGFAGRIDYEALNKFYNLLRQNDIPFFIEEDRIYQAQLYYAGRNMNLRPYVWNTLSFDGDEYSSIAIIDTGVDDSHNFFSPGYPTKIVGWRDEINGLTSPYDDNGHGSHCSGISAGEGSPNYDGSGRTVATAAYAFDYSGYDIPSQTLEIDWTRFNVTDPGLIELFCEFDDFTPGLDDCDFWVYLYYGNTMVDSYEVGSDSWSQTLSYTATSGSLGVYSFRLIMTLIDNTADGYVSDFNIRFRSEIHWPLDPPPFGSGDPWKGIAPDANLVGVKVLDQYGGGWTSDIVDGINWVITNKMVYNITTMSLSLGGGSGDTALINAVNNAVENGIVTVVSAGNDGPGGNSIGSPGDADNVITVAAMSIDDEITDYSSQGGPSYTGNTVKPDITAPGGSNNNLQMFSTDTNDNDAMGAYPTDVYANDMEGAQGTSMSAPAVAGASNLLIEAMGGHEDWGYTATEAKRVKALLLMTATETYPLLRETYSTTYSPLLNRGGKDVHEGYGRLNVDVAIEAFTQELTLGSQFNAWITSSLIDPFNKHGLGCYANLVSGQFYVFTLDVPSGADFDLHLYSDNPSSIGEPIMVASSTSTGLGTDEIISYTATSTGKYYLIAKAISGEGNAIISYPIIDHELNVSLEVPSSPDVGDTYIINATVTNTGNNDENNVDLLLYLDTILVDSTTVSTLPVGASETINYMWIPPDYGIYNFTAYAPPVPDESYLANNLATELVSIMDIALFDGMFINYTFTIFDTIYPSQFTYSYVSGNIFHVDWVMPTQTQYWDVDTQTRIMESSSGGFAFGNGYHTPIWIFTDVSVGDQISIAVDAEGDHLFEVSSESIYNLPGFGLVEVWELEDLTLPGGIAWYEKSTGVLLNGTFLFSGGSAVYAFDFVDTNVQFSYITLDHELKVSLEVPSSPDVGDTYIVNATVFNNGNNDESNVELFLYLDNVLVDSIIIFTLPIGASETINYMWIPPDYGTYNFTAYAPPVPDEIFAGNNFVTEIIHIVDTQLFDGMYIAHDFTDLGFGTFPSNVLYTYNTGEIFDVAWDLTAGVDNWQVDSLTREITGSLLFPDFTHTPMWIFPSVSLGDTVLISSVGDGDHTFEVIGELIYDLPGFDWVDVWVLQDLGDPNAIALYEKSTGILLNGTFYYTGGNNYIIFEFVDTNVQFSYITLDHELKVSLEVPSSPDVGDTYIVNATVFNNGNNDESNVELFLYLDNVLVDSIIIFTLPIGASETINYMWIPPDYGIYNFTAYAPPVPDETFTGNNRITKLISIRKTIFFEDFESGLSKWETITGLWHLTDDTSIWLDPYHSPTHSMWFGNEATGDYDTGYPEMGDLISYPIDLSSFEDTILEFYHWREGEGFGWDVSFVYISTDGFNWDLLYESDTAYIPPWEKVSLDISGYAGNSSVQLKFSFDTFDEVANDYRGWLVDDIEILGTPSLTITTPDSTSSWETGTSQSITWTLIGTISDVKIELYDNDVFVMEITPSTFNDGEFSWTIPSGLADSTQYQIKITDVANPATDDFSDNFEIFTTPVVIHSITITNPDSLTAWEMGTSQDITWTSTGTISDVKIELYKDGEFEKEIVASTANGGSYNWDIPTDLEDGIDYQIRISDASNSATYSESPNFALTTADTGDGTPGVPGYNLLFLLGIIITISVITIIKTGKRKLKLQ